MKRLSVPFAQEKLNLWRLYNVAIAFGKRPSEIMPTETALADYQLDEVCLFAGRQIEKRLANGEAPFEESAGQENVRSMRGLVTKTVKIKEDGTW